MVPVHETSATDGIIADTHQTVKYYDEDDFNEKNQRTNTTKTRRDCWNFFGTAIDYVNSSWCKDATTTKGSQGVLNGSAIAATATSSGKCNVYFQDTQRGIREYVKNGVWKAMATSIFEARMFSPLAVISFNSGKEIRVYSVSKDEYLQEWCYSSDQRGWHKGYLTDSKFRVAANTRLAAVYWADSGANVRVYCQEPDSSVIQEYCNGEPWTRGSILPAALSGSSIAAVSWFQNGIHIRVYYQAPDMTLREHCWDGSWYEGPFRTDKLPRHTSIAATAWYDSSPQIRVYSQDARRRIAAYKYSGEWSSDGIVIGPLQVGVLSSVIEWNSGSNLRLYYQADCDDIHEGCRDSDEAWVTESIVVVDC